MLAGFVIALSALGQQPMDFKARQIEDSISLLGKLPRDQFKAAKQIILLGGDVWPCPAPQDNVPERIAFTGPKFTDREIRLLEPFYGTSVYTIGCGNTRLTNEGIARMLAQFPNAKNVGVMEKNARDGALAPLAGFHDLEQVTFRGQGFTSSCLKHLTRQSKLRQIDVSETPIDDGGLQYFENLQALKWLSLGRTKITAAGLSSLGKINSLETLLINETDVDDVGFKHLEGLQKLQSLRLDGTKITNRARVRIAKLSSLKDLCVENTQVDEKGLAILQNMPKLEEIRWVDPEKATPEQKRFHLRFHFYLPAHRDRWKDQREKFERGELEIKE